MSKKIFQGVRVIEMCQYLSGPFCGMQFADLGAEVIKVEKKGRGDDTRAFSPIVNGSSLYFPTFNRNKKSLEINFRDPEDIKILEKLIARSDVLIENFRPGVLTKMGLSPNRLKEINPKLIVADISGFGQNGPYADRGGFDWIAQAMSGIMSVTGTEESGPCVTGFPVADEMTGLYTAFAVAGALFYREVSGEGNFIDVSLLDSMITAMQTYIPRYDGTGEVNRLVGYLDPVVVPARRFDCKDGYVYIHSGTDVHYRKLAEYLDNPVLLQEKYRTNAPRFAEREIVEGEIMKWTREHTCQEVDRTLYEIGIPCGIVNDVSQVCEDPHLKYRGTLVEVDTDNVGKVKYPGNAYKFANGGPDTYNRAPRLGEHNEEILRELGVIE